MAQSEPNFDIVISKSGVSVPNSSFWIFVPTLTSRRIDLRFEFTLSWQKIGSSSDGGHPGHEVGRDILDVGSRIEEAGSNGHSMTSLIDGMPPRKHVIGYRSG